jgi:hypothetical protein
MYFRNWCYNFPNVTSEVKKKMSVKLELETIGWRTAPGGQAVRTEELANLWKVKNVGVFKEQPEIFNVGGNEPVFHIRGRKEKYKSKEDALADLQKEADADADAASASR